MKIQIVSDLHLENGNTPIISKTDADIIVLAGDISRGFNAESKYAVNLSKRHQKKVIIVNGNASFYDLNIYEEQKKWRNAKLKNVIYLDHTTGYIAEGINFLGGTLWVDYTDKVGCYAFISDRPKDFSSIMVSTTAIFNPDISTHQHLLLLGHIEHNLSPSHKNVIITHHPPTYRSCPQSDSAKDSSCHFATDLDSFVKENDIALWVHGHSHESFDYVLGGTRMVCNPYGDKNNPQSKVNLNYNSSLVVDV